MKEKLAKMLVALDANYKLGNNAGLPIVSLIYNGESEFQATVNKHLTKELKKELEKIDSNDRKNFIKSTLHSEQICINKEITESNLTMIVTVPPCEHCINHIIESEKVKRIYFISNINYKHKRKEYERIYNKKIEHSGVQFLKYDFRDKDEIKLAKEIFDYYKNYIIKCYLKKNSKKLIENANGSNNVYLNKERFENYIDTFEIINEEVGKRVFYSKRNGIWKVKIDRLRKWYENLDDRNLEKNN